MKNKAFAPLTVGFTLIELVLVIAIISILSALIIPQFINLQKEATIKQEGAIITALKEATAQEHMRNLVENGRDEWPSQSPFELLNPFPPYGPFISPPDKVHWMCNRIVDGSYNRWYIACPHYISSGSVKGSCWIYYYQCPSNPEFNGKWQFAYDNGH